MSSIAARFACTRLPTRARTVIAAATAARTSTLPARALATKVRAALPTAHAHQTNIKMADTQYGTVFPAVPRANGIAKVVVGASTKGADATRVAFHTKDEIKAAVGGGAWARRRLIAGRMGRGSGLGAHLAGHVRTLRHLARVLKGRGFALPPGVSPITSHSSPPPPARRPNPRLQALPAQTPSARQ
jgi:hypothetical protein